MCVCVCVYVCILISVFDQIFIFILAIYKCMHAKFNY